jgi:predicted negative regulator of RcsB-dependent stress response
MTREKLREASDELRKAAEATDDADLIDRLHDQSNGLAKLADAEKGPDHGRMARIMNALSEMADAANDEAEAHITAARDAVADYRSTVEGV